MKVLKGYPMPFLKSKPLCLALLLVATSSFANEENILSKERLEIFELSKKQNIENSSKLTKDWINPINYTYSQKYGETYDTTKSYISINQPLFKSGGIFAAIKYANALEKYSYLDIDLQKKAMIKDATTLLFKIHRNDLSIKKQSLLLDNAQIDIIRKKEQVLNGFLDTSFLDNAILEANLRKNVLVELEYQKEELVNNFNNLASGEYHTFKLPKLSLLNKEEFLTKNLDIKRSNYDIAYKYQFKNMAIAKYLPTFNVTYDYTKYHDTDNNPSITSTSVENYGFSVTMPLDIRASNDMQTTKLDYMKSKISQNNLILEQNNFFKSKTNKIKMLRKKATIAKSDYELYNSLLGIISEEKEAGLKTQSDVDTLKNSQTIKSYELEILKLEEQIELLELYSKLG